MKPYYRLFVKKPIELLDALLCIFNEQAKISFEGEFSSRLFEELPDLSTDLNEPCLGSMGRPEQNFVIIPITADTVDILRKKVLHQVGLRKNVAHVLISKNDKLVFWSYDWFHRYCVGLSIMVPEAQVIEFCERGILKEYEIIRDRKA